MALIFLRRHLMLTTPNAPFSTLEGMKIDFIDSERVRGLGEYHARRL